MVKKEVEREIRQKIEDPMGANEYNHSQRALQAAVNRKRLQVPVTPYRYPNTKVRMHMHMYTPPRWSKLLFAMANGAVCRSILSKNDSMHKPGCFTWPPSSNTVSDYYSVL